jgi:hypothetical protein
MQARLDNSQETLHARAQDRRARTLAAQNAFHQADQEYGMQVVKGAIAATLHARLPGKTKMASLKAQRTPLHQTGLTRSLSRVVNLFLGVHPCSRKNLSLRHGSFPLQIVYQASRTNATAATGVHSRRERSSFRLTTQPRLGVRFSPTFQLSSNAFMIFTRQDSFSAFHSANSSHWYVADSGCQETISSVLNHFIDSILCKVLIQTAKSGAVITATLRGKLRLPVSDDDNSAIAFDIPSGIYTSARDKPLLSIVPLLNLDTMLPSLPRFPE